MTGLPCLSLHQPYATLMALDVKTIETRKWRAPKALMGQRMGLHAAKSTAGLIHGEHFGRWRVQNYTGAWHLSHLDDQASVPLPLGAIVATGVLAGCVPVPVDAPNEDGLRVCWGDRGTYGWTVVGLGDTFIDQSQLPYGDYSPGRWAWLYEDVKPTTERCPACWGSGLVWVRIGLRERGMGKPCPTCKGAGYCDPIPARGRQRVWRWTP